MSQPNLWFLPRAFCLHGGHGGGKLPVFPAPSLSWGRDVGHGSGAECVARAMPLGLLLVFSTCCLTMWIGRGAACVIASVATQSRVPPTTLDCFARNDGVWRGQRAFILRCHPPRRRRIQYAAAVVVEQTGRGVLDSPLSRGMTGGCEAGACAVWSSWSRPVVGTRDQPGAPGGSGGLVQRHPPGAGSGAGGCGAAGSGVVEAAAGYACG